MLPTLKKVINYKNLLLIFVLVGAFLSLKYSLSSTSISNITQYNKWLNNNHNGCLAAHTIGGVSINVKYQPPSYLILKDINNRPYQDRTKAIDSMLDIQKKSLTFLMTIGPANDNKPSIMNEGVENYSQYVKRVLTTNFFMDSYISLYIDDVAYKPAMVLVENVYELSNQRNFLIVFVPDGKTSLPVGKDYVLVYNDPVFNMGKVQFDFQGTDLSKANNLKINWN